MKKVLSYGGGVQTFAMLILIEKGILPKPDLVIFADTRAEYPETEAHVEGIAKPLVEKLGIRWETVVHGTGLIDGYSQHDSIPLPGFRSCTGNFKVRPIHKFLTEWLGEEKKRGKASVETWIGISTDEAKRAVPREKQEPRWVLCTYPLLELKYSRNDLIQLIEESEYPMPIKSGCYLCPYSGMKGFIKLKMTHPDLFNQAKEMENRYFEARPDRRNGFLEGIRLDDIAKTPTLFSFEEIDSMINEQNECDSGGCFL